MGDDDPFGSYGLKSICLSDKPVFDQCLSFCSTRLSDYTFANTFVWRQAIHLHWKLIHDCICVFANGDGGLTMLFPPIGPGDTCAAVRESLAICDDYNAEGRLEQWTRIEYVSKEILDRLPAGGFVVEPMSGDYVYSTASMIDLPGGDLASKRQARNRFARRYEAHIETYDPRRHADECLEMLKLWHTQGDEVHAEPKGAIATKRSREVAATAEALALAPQIGLTGMVLYASGRLVGFTLGEMLDANTCSIAIEKTDRECVGSAQYIFSEFCRRYWSHSRFCNVGDDWDIPTLAWTKQSYRPLCRIEKFVIRPVRSAAIPAPLNPLSGELVATTPDETPTSFELYRAGLSDIDALMALENQSFAQPLALTRRQLRYLLRSPSASVHVLRYQGRVVGDALLLRRRRKDGVSARLYSIAIDASCRGKGFGRALLTNCLDVLKAEGVDRVMLEVDVENTAAIGLYESFGFRRVRRLKDYYGPSRDGWKMHAAIVPIEDKPTVAAQQAAPAGA